MLGFEPRLPGPKPGVLTKLNHIPNSEKFGLFKYLSIYNRTIFKNSFYTKKDQMSKTIDNLFH